MKRPFDKYKVLTLSLFKDTHYDETQYSMYIKHIKYIYFNMLILDVDFSK